MVSLMAYVERCRSMASAALGLGACLILASETHGQVSAERRNAVYVELLGNGFQYSVNYQRLLLGTTYLRIGAGYLAVQEIDGEEVDGLGMFPIMVGYVTDTSPHALELGVGVAPVVTRGNWADVLVLNSDTRVVGTATVGYRYAAASGFLLRLGLTPLFGDEGFSPWGGLSLGYRF